MYTYTREMQYQLLIVIWFVIRNTWTLVHDIYILIVNFAENLLLVTLYYKGRIIFLTDERVSL
jgi:hypothetical protein